MRRNCRSPVPQSHTHSATARRRFTNLNLWVGTSTTHLGSGMSRCMAAARIAQRAIVSSAARPTTAAPQLVRFASAKAAAPAVSARAFVRKRVVDGVPPPPDSPPPSLLVRVAWWQFGKRALIAGAVAGVVWYLAPSQDKWREWVSGKEAVAATVLADATPAVATPAAGAASAPAVATPAVEAAPAAAIAVPAVTPTPAVAVAAPAPVAAVAPPSAAAAPASTGAGASSQQSAVASPAAVTAPAPASAVLAPSGANSWTSWCHWGWSWLGYPMPVEGKPVPVEGKPAATPAPAPAAAPSKQ